MGARSQSAADAPAGRAAFRPLLPAERFRRTPTRSSGSRQVRSHRAPRSFIAMMQRSAISRLLLLGAIAANALPAAAQTDNPAPPARIMLEDDADSSAIRVLDAAGPLPFPVGVRIAMTSADADAALDARLDLYSRRRVPVWLSLPVPDAADKIEPWRQSLLRLLDRHGAALAIL